MGLAVMSPLVPGAGDVVLYALSTLAFIMAVIALFDLARTSHIKGLNKVLIALAIIVFPLVASGAWLVMRWKKRHAAAR